MNEKKENKQKNTSTAKKTTSPKTTKQKIQSETKKEKIKNKSATPVKKTSTDKKIVEEPKQTKKVEKEEKSQTTNIKDKKETLTNKKEIPKNKIEKNISEKETIIEKQELLQEIKKELNKTQPPHQKNIKPKKKKRKLKKSVYKTILFLLIIIWLFSVFKIVNWYNDNKQIENQTEEIHETTKVKEIDSGEEINPPENKFDPYWDFIKIPLVSVDFSELIKENNDTVGWIFVDSSNINYPVVQTTDNDFYLNHGFDKQYNDAGWVFMDYRNNSESFGKNTIIYAHSRIDRSLFGTLRNATKEEWFNDKNNHIIKFSTPYENTMWMVFSSYTIEAEGYYLKTDFKDESDYKVWLDEMVKRSKFNYNTEVNTDDQILTLSSCYTADGIRVAVHAKLIKKEVR